MTGVGDTLTIREAEAADGALRDAAARLIPQLSPSSPPPTIEQLRRVVDDPATTLFVASNGGGDGDGADGDGEDGGAVVGMLTLAVFMLPTGVRAWIEDVVVDDASRGAGVASALVAAALERAQQQGARTVDLTSRPEREAANRLYLRLGFARRETNVYRKVLRLPR
jgi:ribosomal protein S18 acetylase RimI-like enzyme